MVYCLNPSCSKPYNSNLSPSCETCGAALLLKERYHAVKLLGQGGFGRTFLGVDQHLPQHPPCAIKQLYLQQASPAVLKKAKELFAQEAVRLSELGQHPQIPRLLAYFEVENQLYLVQEFIEGQVISAKLWQRVRDKEAQIWRLLRDLLPVLQYIHERNVIHRDLKPENIMWRKSDRRFVLIDFGVARMLTQTAIMGGATIIGTPGFMAPEQLRGKVLPASDVFSLGVTCLHLLTGVSPEAMFDVLNERWEWRKFLTPDTTISPKLNEVLNLMISPSLRQRVQSAEALLKLLGRPTRTPPPPPPLTTSSLVIASPASTSISRPVTDPNQPTVAISREETQEEEEDSLQLMPRQESMTPSPLFQALQEVDREPIVIDYNGLQDLLKRKRWQAADDETWRILCELSGKREGAYLSNSDLERLPCGDLQTLDLFWYQASGGLFGFRVQAAIYQEVGGECNLFCDRLGWTLHDPHSLKYFQFNLKAPPGHLPSRRWVMGVSWWKHLAVFAQRLSDCEVN
ncbi:GUN4 domain-containing protein [Spirulina subsalsa FACHB-351]|uniref:non-specific serine/threonine protein kinase n=2 Tax=Spirulina subsalsa TaxID=54311 RepID=A0ABT3L3T2_9CYAN|nr:GUN4 domain-containing protein [Spirulina subsalsa FACHB-351]